LTALLEVAEDDAGAAILGELDSAAARLRPRCGSEDSTAARKRVLASEDLTAEAPV
jgi:hypothetical protein